MSHVWRNALGVGLLAVFSSPGAVIAQSGGDSVVGEAGELGGPYKVWSDVHSGPNGERPLGSMAWHGGGGLGPSWRVRPTCLGIRGNTAVIGFSGTLTEAGIQQPITGIVRVVDYGAWLDTFEYANDVPPFYPSPGAPPKTLIPAPADCSSYPGPFPLQGPIPTLENLVPAGLVVTDGPLPPPPPQRPTLNVERQAQLQRALTRGIVIEFTCASACWLDARLYLSARQARRHRLTTGRKPIRLGSAAHHLASSGTARLVVKPSRSARRSLRRANALRLTLKTTLVANDFRRKRTSSVRLEAERREPK